MTRRRARGVRVPLEAALLLVLLPGWPACHGEPGPGDSCKHADMRCADPHTELTCEKGVFVAAPCKGPLGCKEDGKHLLCDFTGNAEGDRCSLEEDGNAKCIGDRQRITCRVGKYTLDWCRGPEGCAATGTAVKCDQARGEPGDPCHPGANACSMDGKKVLVCQTGALAVTATCPGEGGCSVGAGQVSCDLGKAAEKPRH